VFWMFGQIATSVFIMACCFAMTQASRQRMNTARLAAELRSANALLELQADQVAVLAVEQERNRLAREIHDAVGHSLTVVGVQLEAAEALIPQSPERALDSIRKAQRASREGLAEIRSSVSSLRARRQEERSLAESLTSLITGAERPGLKLTLQQSGKSRTLPSLVEISLYRCAQEGITNACRHAGASEISVHLDFTSETSVVLSVADNGRGFSAIPENSHGLQGLRQRAALLKGDFFAGTEQQGGGCCRMVVPA
jgi:signal transduction histidine kinase